MAEITRHGVHRRWSDIVCHRGVAYFVEVPENPELSAAEQFAQVLAQTAATLQQVNSDMTRLLTVMVYLPHSADLAEFNRLWDSWVPEGHAPSRACVHAPLAAPGYRVELVITAALAESSCDASGHRH